MTAKTHGYITKEIELEQIYQFILKWFDPAAKLIVTKTKRRNNEMAVYFTYKGEERRLFAIVYIKVQNFLKQDKRKDRYF